MRGHSGCKCGPSLVAWILVLVGAINWGLVGVGELFGGNWNVVNLILGNWSALESIIYILVGIAGVMLVFGCKCKKCNPNKGNHGGDMNGQSSGNQM